MTSQFALNRLITPATSLDSMLAWLSQIHGIAGGLRGDRRRRSCPTPAARWAGSVISAALSMAVLIALSLSSGQFELFDGTMCIAVERESRIDWGSLKSLIHPTFGHTFGSFFGTSQNFVYMTSVVDAAAG